MSDQYSGTTAVLIVLACFGFGFWAISQLMRKYPDRWRPREPDATVDSGDWRADPNHEARTAREGQEECARFRSAEEYYRHVLGVSETAGEAEVRTAYRQLLAKYHPDKVSHLGDEFLSLASRRTKELIEAYEFLSHKHGYK